MLGAALLRLHATQEDEKERDGQCVNSQEDAARSCLGESAARSFPRVQSSSFSTVSMHRNKVVMPPPVVGGCRTRQQRRLQASRAAASRCSLVCEEFLTISNAISRMLRDVILQLGLLKTQCLLMRLGPGGSGFPSLP